MSNHEKPEVYVRRLPAAAIPRYSKVRIEGRDFVFSIDRIDNATPEPGKITWTDEDGLEEVVGGNEKIEVVELP
jgi:hypothetical protein